MTLTAGLGFKPEHLEEVLARPAAGLWYEIHAENYMLDGGPRLAMLHAVRREHPVAVHGVGLSLAADARPADEHLRRLHELVRRIEPCFVSEHLAWSSWNGQCFPDLLPFPRTRRTLARIARNIAITQDRLGRRILIENPSQYLALPGHEMTEVEFLVELADRTGCALLLDVNNVYVSARNLELDAEAWIAALPARLIEEVHLAGHGVEQGAEGTLFIDTHGAPISPEVWALYERLIARIGPRPTLIERDEDIPAFSELLAERNIAESMLDPPDSHLRRYATHV
jgi:uncharacterized protein